MLFIFVINQCCYLFYSFIFYIEFYSYLDLLFITVFICFLIIFFCAENFNINYLLIPNIVAVALSFSFNAVIHFIIYLCLNRFILVFSGIVLLLHLFIYELRTLAYYTKIFFNIQIYFCCFLIFFAVSLQCSKQSSLIFQSEKKF